MPTIEASLTEQRDAARVRFEVRFRQDAPTRQGTLGEGLVWYEVAGDLVPPPPAVADAAVLALLFPAMRLGCDLAVRGAVSRRLLANLEDFQAAWHAWRPGRYRPARIRADSVVAAPRRAWGAAVAAYSGGLDGACTLLRHSRGLAGAATRPLAAAVLVQGFDIALGEAAAFATVEATARRTLAGLGVPLSTVATNWREVLGDDWEMEFFCALAACLHLFRGSAGAGLVGSATDYSHAHELVPWGSNPITDRLLSGDDFDLVVDGLSATRSEKAALVATCAPLRDTLRVCWQGPVAGVNCGRCEKCLRTQMNFLASGQSPGPAFPAVLRPGAVLRLRARNAAQLGLLKEIRATARRQGVEAPWLRALGLCIGWNELRNGLAALPRRIPPLRRALKRLRRLSRRAARGRTARGRAARGRAARDRPAPG